MSAFQSSRVQLQPAYVLHRRPYRETSLILDAFSRDYGKVSLLAKGVRGGKSARIDAMPPFRAVLLSWSGKSDMPLLTGVESPEPTAPLQGIALYCGLYLNELLQAFLHKHDPHARLFQCYGAALAELAGGDDKEYALRSFELELLQELGYGLQLHCDADRGLDIEPDRLYRYDPEQGPLAAGGTGATLRGATLIALREGRLDDADCRREAKGLLRRVIHHHLAGRPLKSRELFRYSQKHEST
ncbi:DNA repair protein RecO [Methylogaea oryzae]|uniref:DNA repair protein RecO n=1 Tax=Methylogaea oryzae TaxID=1295382 RepID=A0A8D4VP24_9GAMM|nr:DNA repair protein RecO [Methylogaea oryzae]BBL70062.1 DNA repair protein RecO [Methylogaea oryzae]